MGTVIVILIALAVVVGWRVSLRLWPNARCRRCAGNGKNIGSTRARWGSCSRCGGSGRRLRAGARAPAKRN